MFKDADPAQAPAPRYRPFPAPGQAFSTVTATSGALTQSAAATVNVTVNSSSITNIIGQLLSAGCIDNSGIATSLTSKLAAAQAAINAGTTKTEINDLNDFKNEVQAQSGKHIAASCTIAGVTFNPATVLLTDVQSLINMP
jgi:hypothetical protein